MEQKYVDFYNDSVLTIKNEHTGEVFIPLKPIVLNLGVDWPSQTVKIKNNKDIWKCCVITTVASDGKRRKQACIPLKNLNGWLLSISPNRVDESIRQKLIKYQEECFTVLYDYWTKGQAINPRMNDNIDFSDPMAFQNPQAYGIIIQGLITGQQAIIDLAAAREKLDRIFKNGMEPLEDLWKKLGMTRQGQPVHYQEGIDKLRKAGILLKSEERDIPFKKLCKARYFDKYEGTLVGTKGTLELIALMEEEGVYTNDAGLQALARKRHVNPKDLSRDEDGTIHIGDEIIVPATKKPKILGNT